MKANLMKPDRLNLPFSWPGHNGGRNGKSRAQIGSGQDSSSSKHADESTITSGKVQIERKVFVFVLKENARGRFLRITEEGKGRHSSIIIPAAGLDDVQRILNDLAKASSDKP